MARLLMQVTGKWQTQLFQVYQSEESSKIIINAQPSTSGQLHQRSIISAVHYNRIYSTKNAVLIFILQYTVQLH